MKRIFFFIILFSSLFSQTKAQNYIPILTDTASWSQGFVYEFGVGYQQYGIDETRNINDTIFYRVMFSWFYEDTVTKRVYNSDRPFGNTDNDHLMYDFSLEEGESFLIEGWSGGTQTCYVDSIRNTHTVSGVRKAWYLHYGDSKLVWVEGIGSLAGFKQNNMEPGLYNWGNALLTCFYQGDELIYKHEFAEIYGCIHEIDPDPPVFETLYEFGDTILVDEVLTLVVIASDQTQLTIEATLVSPSGIEYIVDGFINPDEAPEEYYSKILGDFHNELGYWYLKQIIIEDEQENITTVNFSETDSQFWFYVKEPAKVPNYIRNNDFRTFPNPIKNISYTKFENNDNSKYQLFIYSSVGEKVGSFETNSAQFIVDVSHLKNGIYLYKISCNNVTTSCQKVFISH